MKQKRKVKSLISSESDNSVLLSTLLFLLGGVLVFGAVALFTSSVGVVSAEGEGDAFEYENGIADNVEVLLNLKFAPDGGSATVNEMEFDGTTFYMEEGNKGISVKDSSAAIRDDAYINYLGGNSSATQINLASNNIAVIGGNGVKVLQGNDNATSLGGNATRISEGGNSVPAVMLGGQTNTIGTNQIGNAIVGGSNNSISNAGQYDFIIGGSNNNINANNVIVGGAKVTANQSNIFVFNDGESSFTPQGGNAFYLNMQHGLGLNRAARNKGVDSEGAVSFGLINIGTQSCASTDVGVEGNWNGCLVGCTQVSSASNKWEMIDHGDICEGLCQAEEKCMVNPIVPLPPEDYPSACTVGGVDTNHSTQCAANRLEVYENVMFETFLIDSDDDCANYDTHQNKCIFKCEKDYHLTGNIAGGSSATKKCYKDCTLPWNGEKIKHNVKVDAYNAKSVACSNTDWVFPLTTAIVNVPNTSEYTLGLPINGMAKAKVGNGAKEGHSYESCTNYSHKKTLVCYDGELYIANTNGTKTNTKALGGSGAWYGYDVCTTRDYKCPTTTYNLTQSYITTNSIAKDTVDRNNTDRSTSIGTRGQYKLCQDWTPSVGNSECKVGLNGANGTVADNYHYQLVKCNDHYSTGTDNNPYECKKSCKIMNLAGNETRTDASGREYLHGSVISGYQNNSVDCTVNGNGSCKVDTIVCNDGERRMRTMNGPKNTLYLYNDCKLNAYKCDARFDLGQTWDHGSYDHCDPYNPNGRFQCVIQPRKYDLVGCDANYHTENNQNCTENSKSARCNTNGKPANASYDYTYETIYWRCAWNGTPVSSCWSPVLNDCDWYCNSNYHREYRNGQPYCVYNTRTIDCEDYVAKPIYAHWDGDGQGTQGWVGTWYNGDWSPNVNGCGWSCDPGYEGDDCGNVITCDCRNNPDYSYCVDTNVQIDEPADCPWQCYYGSDGAGGCLPPTYECHGSKPSGATLNSNTSPSNDNTNYFCNASSSAACAYSCPSGQECNGTSGCKDVIVTYECHGSKPSGATLNSNTSPSNDNTNYFCDASSSAACAYSCPSGQACNGTSGCKDVIYSCQGSKPSGATLNSNTLPSDNSTNYFCNASSTAACAYSCPSGQECNGTSGCKDKLIECGAGKYLPANSTSCSTCTAGSKCTGGRFYKSTSDQGIEQCACGTYSNAGASACTNCGAGKWSSAGSSSCSDISCGYYGTSACSAKPNACASGKYSAAGSSSCSSCPANQEPNSTQCGCVDKELPTTCTFDGDTYEVGETAEGYTAQNNCSAACSKTTATCQSNGKWNKTIYADCTNTKVTCGSGPMSGYPNSTLRGTCVSKKTWNDGCGGTITCYDGGGCPAEYVCAKGVCNTSVEDCYPRENGDYCVRNNIVCPEGGCDQTTCFMAGTKVTMADGSQKDIEDVKIGEKVLGSNRTINTVLGYDRPVLGNRHLWSINGSEYFVSDEHPFMTTKGWKSFNPEMTKLEVDLNTTELKVGDVLIRDNGLEEIKTVDYIEKDYNTPLFNLMLDGDHTYYANNYLVHNKGDDPVTGEECTIIQPYVSSSCSIGTCGLGFSVTEVNGDHQVSNPVEVCEGEQVTVGYCIRGTGNGEDSCSDHQACTPDCFAGGTLPNGASVVCYPTGDC